MNLFELATRGVDLASLPDEPAPRERIAFEPSANTGKFSVPSDLNAAFDAAANDFGIDPDVLRAVAFAESRFRPDIISGEKRSSAGAIGLMQFMPETADEYGINPTDPVESIFGAAAYLRKSLDKFGGDYGKAVASYNAGPNRKAFDAADWDQRMPAETQGYLRTVFTAADQLKQGGAATAKPTQAATAVPDTGDETARLAARYKAPDAPQQGGMIQAIGDFFKPAPTSVLESYKPTAAEQQAANAQRLRYGAGPIKGDVLVAANEVASGNANSSSPTVNTVAKQMQERGDTFTGYAQAKNTPILKEGARDAKAAEFRSAGEWAIDTASGIAQGTVTAAGMLPNVLAPSSELARNLKGVQQAWAEQESDVLKAQRAQLKARVDSEEGFAGKYAATVYELVTNPALGLSEAAKQVPNFLAVMAVSRLGAAAAGAGFVAAEKASPILALSNAIGGGAMKAGAQAAGATTGGLAASVVMTSGDAAGNVYDTLTDPVKTPKAVWEQNEDYQALIAQGVSHKEAVKQIASAKAQFAAMVVAPLGAFGFMGADAALATRGIAGLVRSYGPKAGAKTFAKEIGGENVEEMGTQYGGNVVARTVNPNIKLDEGVAEAGATATITSAPFAGYAAYGEARGGKGANDAQDPRSQLIAAGLLDPQTYNPSTIGADGTANPLLERMPRKPAPTVESQPTTPTVPPSAPTAPAADATQAVDNIAALLRQTEENIDGASPVDDWDQTLAEINALSDGSGQSESAQSLTDAPLTNDGTTAPTQAVAPAVNPITESMQVARQMADRKGLTAGIQTQLSKGKSIAQATKAMRDDFDEAGIPREEHLTFVHHVSKTLASQPTQQTNPTTQAAPAPDIGAEMAAMKERIKTRLGLIPARQDEATAPAEKRKPSELLAAIKRAGGIKSTNAGDLMGGSAMDANRILPGLFTKGGMNLDLLVPFLKERGYLTQADEDNIKDNGGVNKLAEILQSELSGDRAQEVDSTAGYEADAGNAIRSELDSKAFALGLPMKVTNEMSTERLNGVINRIERKLGKPVNTDFATRKMSRTEAMAERQAILMADRVERARAQYDADIQAFAEANDGVQDAVLDVFTDENGDVVIVNERDADAELAARDLNGTWSDQNGQETTTAQDSRSGTDTREAGAPVARGSDQGAQNNQANRTEAGAGSQEGLTSYTPAEVTARQDAATEAEATAKRAEDAAARAEAAAKQASEIARRSVAAADTFELGGNAEDNLSGQEGLRFSRSSDINAARAALAKIMEKGVTSPDDLRDLLRVPGYSKWAKSAIAGDVAGAASLRRELQDAFPGSDWKAPKLIDQGIITIYPDWVGLTSQSLDKLTKLADKYDTPIGVRGGAATKQLVSRLDGFGFELYNGLQERADRMPNVMFGMIRPAGGITATTPLFSRATQSPSTPVSTIRQAITKAYGNILTRLEGKGLVSLTQTEEEAIAAAAQARADQTGGDVEAIKESLRKSVLASQRAWHGTPHRGIEKFSTDKIGTGEGAQAFGYGLYYADRQELAEGYRKKLSAATYDTPTGNKKHGEVWQSAFDAAYQTGGISNDIARRIANDVTQWIDEGRQAGTYLRSYSVTSTLEPGYKSAMGALKGVKKAQGQLYEVDIPNDSDMLLWDKPMSQQTEAVRDAIMPLLQAEADRRNAQRESLNAASPARLTHPVIGKLANKVVTVDDINGQAAYEAISKQFGGDRQASEHLAGLGVKGIKYLDGQSRYDGDGTYNYVVFSGDDVQIVDVKYSKDGNLEGFFDPATGKSFLIADNLTAESAPATLMHEVGIHMAADGKLEPVFDRAGNLLKMARDNEFIQRVQSRMDEAGETSNEEAAAYIVTEYERDRTNAPQSVGKWIKDFIADVRAWLFNKGVLLKADQLTVADIAAVARANANRMAQGDANGDVRYSKAAPTDQTQTDAFKRWFGDSKVVDDDGKPLVVYHGNAGDFSEFDLNRSGETTGNTGFYGAGAYFSEDAGYASGFAMWAQRSEDDAPNVMPVYLALKNPAYIVITPQSKSADSSMLERSRATTDSVLMYLAKRGAPYGVTSKLAELAEANKFEPFMGTLYNTFGGGQGVTEILKGAGFDGVTVYGGIDGKMQLAEAVAFNPTQIKSAKGNNGDFDGDNPDIRRSVRGGGQQAQQNLALNTPSPAWMLPASTKTDALVYEIQDQKVDLKRTQEAIKAAGRTITEPFDARMAETLMPGRVAYRTETFLKTEVAPLMEAMAKNNVTQNELSDYLLARHAPERNAQIAKVNPDPDMQDGGAGTNSAGVLMTTQAAQDHIAALTTGKRMVLQLLANKIDAITASTRDMLVREGLEKQSTMDAWTGAYKHYVPLFKDEAVESPAHPIGSGMSVTGSASKRAMGSEGEVTNMVAHILMQREAAITRAEKNRVAMSLYGLALSNPNQEVWTTIRPNMRADKIGAELAAMGVDPVEAEQGMQGVPTIRTINAVTGLVQETPNPMYKRLENALVVKVDGEDRVVLFNAKNADAMRMARALKNQDGLTNFDLAGSMVGTATRYFASINTQYNPAFGMVNVVRDVGGALVNLTTTDIADKKAKVLGDIPAAMKGIARDVRGDQARTPWSDLWVQFQEDGGRTGYRDLFIDPFKRAEAVQKDLDAMQRDGTASAGRVAHSILDLLDDFNTTLENGVRLSAYKAALDKGMSRPAAAKMARELTVDFNRKGRMGREIGPLYAFFNASVQGTARTVESLKGPAGKKIIAGGLMLGVIQSLMLAAAGFDDDEPPEFVKARAFIIPTGDKRYIAIPLQFGLNALPNTGRVITDLLLTGGKDAGKKTFNAIGEIMGSFNPLGGGNIFTAHGLLTTVAPTVADPLIDLATNTNFAGTPIGKDRADWDTRPGAKLARESTQRSLTGQAYIGISKAINAVFGGNEFKKGLASPTPEQVQYVFTTAGGGLYRELEKTLNIAGLKADGFEVKSRMIPLGGRFAGEADDQDTQRTRYFKNTERLSALEAELKGFEQAGDDANVDRIEKDKADEVDLLDDYKAIRRDITKLNKLAAENITDTEMLKELDAERLDLMRELNDSVRKLEKRSELFKRD